MNMDFITLKFQSVVSKMKSDLSEAIGKYEKLDSTMNKVANNLNKMTNSAGNVGDSFKASKEKIESFEKELKDLTREYNRQKKAFEERPAFSSVGIYNPTEITGKTDPNALIVVTQEKLEQQKARISELENTIQELKEQVEQPIKQPELIRKDLVPKTEQATQNIKKTGKEADSTNTKVGRLSNSMRSLGRASASIGSKGFDLLKSKFSDFSKSLKKNVDGNVKQIKKLALGLIGVRTVMSVLTKSVNAYLSFDTELQESLSNSWNMLGALLAPAIELVARMFALATNYIASFVNALTGIDLVARANAKALNSQAKATQKAANAQRGLLGMDEITNLPTESGGDIAKQISRIDVKPIRWLSDLLEALKKYKWHRAGEIIADSISNGLKKIDWDTIREKAEQTGTNIADFLNGVFEIKWGLVGSSFANGLNTLVDFVYGFVNKIEWGRVGAGIATSINNFFNDFDFAKLAETINKTLEGVIDAVSVFITNLDEQKIADGIKTFVETIDWLEIGEKIIKLLVKGLKSAIKINNALWDGLIGDVRTELSPKIEKLGDNIGGDLGKKIANALKTALESGLSTIENVFNPIGSRFKDIKNIVNGTASFFGFAPPLATGTNEIEYEGLYHLHEGEAVVPKRYNPATGGYDSSADNRQIIDLLVSLNSSMLEYADRPININMSGRKVAEATYDSLQQIDRNRNNSTTMVRS